MMYIKKELRTQELKQELYREWVDTKFNGKSAKNSFLLGLVSTSLALLSLLYVMFLKEGITDDKLPSVIVFIIVILGIVIVFLYHYLSLEKKQKEKLEKIEYAIECCTPKN